MAFSVTAYVMGCITIYLPTQADAMILHVFCLPYDTVKNVLCLCCCSSVQSTPHEEIKLVNSSHIFFCSVCVHAITIGCEGLVLLSFYAIPHCMSLHNNHSLVFS